jgi:hypothetical protein
VPKFKLPAIPTPPLIIKAPVDVLTEAVVALSVNDSALTAPVYETVNLLEELTCKSARLPVNEGEDGVLIAKIVPLLDPENELVPNNTDDLDVDHEAGREVIDNFLSVLFQIKLFAPLTEVPEEA